MQILEQLESMWAPKIKRKVPTIPEVKFDSEFSVGTLDNDEWYFRVPYAFREALDIKFEERKKIRRFIWSGLKGLY